MTESTSTHNLSYALMLAGLAAFVAGGVSGVTPVTLLGWTTGLVGVVVYIYDVSPKLRDYVLRPTEAIPDFGLDRTYVTSYIVPFVVGFQIVGVTMVWLLISRSMLDMLFAASVVLPFGFGTGHLLYRHRHPTKTPDRRILLLLLLMALGCITVSVVARL